MSTNNLNVVVLAAGLGTRMKSKLAKVLHRVGGLSLAEHVVNSAAQLTAPEKITVVVGHQAGEVQAELQNTGVRFVRQAEQKGTGHALLGCRDLLAPEGGRVMVLYGDTPLLTAETLRKLEAAHEAGDAAATMITTTLADPTGYGRVILDSHGNVLGIVEQKAASAAQLAIRLINSGIYLFDAERLWTHISEIRADNPAHEYYLTDIAGILNDSGHRVRALQIDDASELLGINTRLDLAEVDRVIRGRKNRELMLAGVTIERPETVTVDMKVRIGADTVLEAGARLLGNTVIGEECRIGAGSIIENSTIGDRVRVAPLTIVESSTIGEDSRVGPYSRLRPNNTVGAGAHIGNFVELKKTRLGAGAKANHLAYLGDSDVGAKVNVGAGTIVCNYDGVSKYPTRIGDGAFVGSNSTLVAPLAIGEGAYVGAGSVITEDVPAGSLALGRARQTVKERWAEKKKNGA
jgi:bifunctional UDP-N-acetylglucosamine pyrophosphorylase/glucosamine-1-phosphate N-acetyltransferase